MSNARVPEYRTTRDWAWRNAMVATTNAGLEQKLFTLAEVEDDWASARCLRHLPTRRAARVEGCVFRFQLGRRAAVASVCDVGFGELSIHVMTEPTAYGEEIVEAAALGTRQARLFLKHCSAYARGYVERDRGRWLRWAGGPPLLSARRWQIEELAAMSIRPRGYQDRG